MMNQEEPNMKSGDVSPHNSGDFLHKQRIIVKYTAGGQHAVRILRPWELKAIVKVISKKEDRIRFEALLYTGMRYSELNDIHGQIEIYDDKWIHLTPLISRKVKSKFRDRYIVLSPYGKRVVEDYLALDKAMPDYKQWRKLLRRWADLAGVSPDYMSSKSLRKTWESYLMMSYPYWQTQIFISQGHTELTALKYYVNLPFDDKDKKEMKSIVAGWEP